MRFDTERLKVTEMDERTINRRRFLKSTALLAGAAAFDPLIRPLLGVSRKVAGASTVTLAAVQGDPAAATRRAIEVLGGMGRFVKKGQTVVVKPNMSFPAKPEVGSNTNPPVVREVVVMCIEQGAARVLVLDHPLGNPKVCLKRAGIFDACKNLEGTHVLNLVDEKFYRPVPVPKGKAVKEVKIMKDALDADVIINVPAAKSHMATGVSMGIKNLMGLILDRPYFHKDVDLDQAIADLATVVVPALTVLDASRVMTEGGPGGPGKLEKLDTIVAGADPVAVDSYGVSLAKWYGTDFQGTNVKHLANSHKLGLGEIDVNKVNVKKETV